MLLTSHNHILKKIHSTPPLPVISRYTLTLTLSKDYKLLNKLWKGGISTKAVKWCVCAGDHKWDFLDNYRCPAGFHVGAYFVFYFVNDLGKAIQAKILLYADDSLIYLCDSSVVQAMLEPQTTNQSIQTALLC